MNDVYPLCENRPTERTAAYNAEVSELKQSLARAEEELGRVRKQLEDKQRMLKTFVLKLARMNGHA